MAAYRFCRPDDTPYLLRAVNECYQAPDLESPLTLEEFRAELRELDVWPSNCMVVSSGSEPIAVSIVAKRPSEVLVYRVGTRSDHRRESHGRHMLNSLSHKLAVLGPPRIVAEVPVENEIGVAFFRSLRYEEEVRYRDFFSKASFEPLEAPELVTPIEVGELAEHGALRASRDCCWERQKDTLLAREDQLKGYALISPDRIEAYLLAALADKEGGVEIMDMGCFRAEARSNAFSVFLRYLSCGNPLSLTVPRVAPCEEQYFFLEDLGFEPAAEYIRFATEAKAE